MHLKLVSSVHAIQTNTCLLLLCLFLAMLSGCTPSTAPQAAMSGSASQQNAPPQRFIEVAQAIGIDFIHDNGKRGHHFFTEITGSGGALFDYDNDGDLDLYAVQAGPLDPASKTLAATGGADRLYRNDLQYSKTGQPILRFTDVTEEAGLNATGVGMGVAIADIDNDGWLDIYLTNAGPDQMWRNQGDGTFRNITEASGLGQRRWSTSAAFADFNRDGLLDLFVVNYVNFHPGIHKNCPSSDGRQDYCGPKAYNPVADVLYQNLGDGKFIDVSAKSGIAQLQGPGLGVVWGDWNRDGFPDLYVANDGAANHYWLNDGAGRFNEGAILAGAAYNMQGVPEASMGVLSGDFDGDQDEDLFMTHLFGETNTLYTNDGKGWFIDKTQQSGLGSPSRRFTGFGTIMLDFNHDGWLDVAIANGAVSLKSVAADKLTQSDFPYAQPNQLFVNRGHGQFEAYTEAAIQVFQEEHVSRGMAGGDLDNDGDTDLVIFNSHEPLSVYLNTAEGDHNWIGFRLWHQAKQRDAVGAKLSLTLSDQRTLMRTLRVQDSYCSSSDPRLLLQFPPDVQIESGSVTWPDGTITAVPQLHLGKYHTLSAPEP